MFARGTNLLRALCKIECPALFLRTFCDADSVCFCLDPLIFEYLHVIFDIAASSRKQRFGSIRVGA